MIFQYQQENFRLAILDNDPEGKCTIIYDGTYGFRGHHSQDCNVTAMTEIPGREKRGIIGLYYVKRTGKDKGVPEGVHTCSAKALEPIATKGAAKSALRPKNGLKMVALNADGDAQDCDNASGGEIIQYGQF